MSTNLSAVHTNDLVRELVTRYVVPLRPSSTYDILGDAAIEFICQSGHDFDDEDEFETPVNEIILSLLMVVGARSQPITQAMLTFNKQFLRK